MLDPMFDSADYTLRWPPELVSREISAVRALGGGHRTDDDRVEFVLAEAFTTDTAAARYRALREQRRGRYTEDPWSDEPDPDGRDPELDFLDQLVSELPYMRHQTEPRPYWPDRQRGDGGGQLDQPAVRRRFAQLIEELRQAGYFGDALPEDCVDERNPPDGDALLARHLGLEGLWPLQPEQWDEDTFLGLVEVFHDLAVRPRERRYHGFDGCGWHYTMFSVDTGQALYRWRVNRLLDSSGLGLRLAETGEDIGRLVHVTDDARAELVDRAINTPDPAARDRVRHAVARFRGRDSTTEDKRQAIVELAAVLEARKQLLSASLFTDDETALFHIANRFDLRHNNDKQHRDYDPAFREWVFWWYLGTIELTDRLLARQATGTSA